ncbi:hypothetical protein B0H17DRAFT_1206690 [Mycena rosella]|uniref:Uncharacterized protein n=1 Tax=Mycena rosella TaxID=1033263 RepID=A0AAD7GCN5_MYCRO|nr:hypothetical protein B0H17DRAFT_1206690 [Mycena rosella]
MPQVCARRDEIHIYACDINPGFQPDPSITELLGIRTLLALCLTNDGWNAAIANFKAILKPGGLLILEELDPIIMTEERSQRYNGEDPNKCMVDSTWMHNANCLYTGFSL